MWTRYSVNKNILNAGFQYANVRYEPTFAYDVDPLLGSTAMPGFAEWATIYRFYRVRSSKIQVMAANRETFNCMIYVTPVNYDPTSNVTPSVFLTSSMLCHKALLGPLTGQNTHTLVSSMTTNDIGGVRDLQIQDGYSAPTSGSSSPANNWFWAVGIFAFANQVSGVDIAVDMEVEIEFFELTSPAG